MTADTLLEVRDLSVRFATPDGDVQAVSDIGFDVRDGEFLGIVGESGSGKSQCLLSLTGLLAKNGRASGSVRYRGQELLNAPTATLQAVRGRRIGMVFQDPMTALNPHLTIGHQLTEGLRHHLQLGRAAAVRRAVEILKAVQLTDAQRRLSQYPHELSGGMRQRVMIAMALVCEPDLILADEPTTALDVTVQAQILMLLRDLRSRFGTAVILVTHDLGVLAQVADRVAVMYAGRMVETGTLDDVFHHPRHPYTEGLQRAIPRLQEARSARLPTIPGAPPNLSRLPPGCAFAPRCRYHMRRCDTAIPPLESVGETHRKACYHDGPLDRVAETAA